MTAEPTTGAPTDLTGGMPATGAATAPPGLDAGARATFAPIADYLIPAAHGMPSAADVLTDERLGFVLAARPDLAEAFRAALRADLGTDVPVRLSALAAEPTNLSALQLVIVAGYYTDARVRELIAYPGQQPIALESWPDWTAEPTLIEQARARGPVWRDPKGAR